MKCKFHKLIYLNKTGELCQKDQDTLDKHLELCSDCKKLTADLHYSNKIIKKLKNIQPQLSSEQELTNNIMTAINNIENKSNVLPVKINWNNIFDWLYFPKIKYAMVCIAISLIGIFIFQQSIIFNKIATLEEKTSGKELENYANTPSPAFLNTINNSRLIDNIKTSNPELNEELIVINKKNLELWAQSYIKLKNENKMLINYIQEKFPQYQREISEKELIKLIDKLSKDKQVIELLHEL